MSATRLLVSAWAAIAALALLATWSQNVAYFAGAAQPADGALAFWRFLVDTRVNPATRSIAADLVFLMLAGVIFMVLEARRLGVRFVWAYVVLGVLVAISVTFPLFMIARQLKIASGGGAALHPPRATAADILGLALTGALSVWLVVFILQI